MIAIYNKKTGKINQVIWDEFLPYWFELSSDEGYLTIYNDIEPHKLHHCKIIFDKENNPIEIEEPFYEDTEPWNISPTKTLKLRWRMKHRIR